MIENLLVTFFGLIIAAAAGRWIIPNILLISMRKRLFDIPDARKVHKYPVPRLGGVSFCVSLPSCGCRLAYSPTASSR